MVVPCPDLELNYLGFKSLEKEPLKAADLMKNKLVSVALVLILASASYGQKTLSAKGYFCGQTEPSYVNVHLDHEIQRSVELRRARKLDAGGLRDRHAQPQYKSLCKRLIGNSTEKLGCDDHSRLATPNTTGNIRGTRYVAGRARTTRAL